MSQLGLLSSGAQGCNNQPVSGCFGRESPRRVERWDSGVAVALLALSGRFALGVFVLAAGRSRHGRRDLFRQAVARGGLLSMWPVGQFAVAVSALEMVGGVCRRPRGGQWQLASDKADPREVVPDMPRR